MRLIKSLVISPAQPAISEPSKSRYHRGSGMAESKLWVMQSEYTSVVSGFAQTFWKYEIAASIYLGDCVTDITFILIFIHL